MAHELPLIFLWIPSSEIDKVKAKRFPMVRPDGSGEPEQSRTMIEFDGVHCMPQCLIDRDITHVVIGSVEGNTALFYGGKNLKQAQRVAKAEKASVIEVEQLPHAPTS